MIFNAIQRLKTLPPAWLKNSFHHDGGSDPGLAADHMAAYMAYMAYYMGVPYSWE